MNWLNLFKLIFSPIFLPLSLVYGIFAWLIRLIQSLTRVELLGRVISVGNFYLGGSGKTPVVEEVVRILKNYGCTPIIISKSYKASLTSPREVVMGSDPLVFGDEAVFLKEKLKDVRVFSGPLKFKTALFAQYRVSKDAVFVIDDGAQHNRIKKDIKIHLWDMSRPFWDIVPLPFGASREFWFLGEKPTLSVLNRSTKNYKEKLFNFIIRGVKLSTSYEVYSILNSNTGSKLDKNCVLISGIGNFNQLSKNVDMFLKNKNFKVIEKIQGLDHDDFKWFTPKSDVNYVCTEKDVVKLKTKINPNFLFVVKSTFSKIFKERLKKELENCL